MDSICARIQLTHYVLFVDVFQNCDCRSTDVEWGNANRTRVVPEVSPIGKPGTFSMHVARNVPLQ